MTLAARPEPDPEPAASAQKPTELREQIKAAIDRRVSTWNHGLSKRMMPLIDILLDELKRLSTLRDELRAELDAAKKEKQP